MDILGLVLDSIEKESFHLIFGTDISNYVHSNNKTKNVLILGEGFAQGLDDATLHAEA